MLRHALRADFPAVIETWTDAFSADPYLRWIPPDLSLVGPDDLTRS